MAKVLISSGKYVQDAGEMKKLGVRAEGYGTKALILISEGGYYRIGKDIKDSFAGTGCTFIFDHFHGEYSKYKIERLCGVIEKNTCNLAMGIGGGKIFGTAEVVARYEKTAVLICPTVAPTDALYGTLSIIYTDERVFKEYLFLPANPNLVLMGTDIAVKSLVRLTVAGMGSVLATCFEARVCEQSDAVSCAGGKVTGAAMAPTKLCFETLMEEDVKAKLALEVGICTPAVKEIIGVNMLPSGIGFESTDLAGAHAIHNGLAVLEECHHVYHGEKVTSDTIAQLALEDVEAAELQEITEFCIELGLPVTPEESGVTEIVKERIMAVAEAAHAGNDILRNMPFETTPDKVYAATITANVYGRYSSNESRYILNECVNHITDYSKQIE